MREFGPDQRSELVVYDLATAQSQVVFDTSDLIEAPNWTLDRAWLIYNAAGRLFRISPDGLDGPHLITTDPCADFNNDHCLDPDGVDFYGSAWDGHIYRCPIAGGTPVRVSPTTRDGDGFRFYLHGVSPDGRLLSFVGLIPRDAGAQTWICTLNPDTGDIRTLTDGAYPVDGPEFSHDGTRIYYNAEQAGAPKGAAQILSMSVDGTDIQQHTDDARVNWFPHLSADGRWMVYLSYPTGTVGHPADCDVRIMLYDLTTHTHTEVDRFNGGQGTINVNSWCPTSQRFAYVRYPHTK